MTARPGSPDSLVAELDAHRGPFHLRVELRAAPGEVVAVVGPNGAGKTTLVRALAGLDPLTGGRILLGSRVLTDVDARVDVPVADREVGLLFQDYRLFPHLSARDNVAFGLRARGTGRRTARASADVWLDRLGLASCARRRPRELSGGQAQRVALARTLAPQPRLLLLDEPLAALDAAARPRLRATLRGHLTAFAGPCLLITHDPIEALVLADRLLVLEAGRLVQDDTPAAVARRPASRYVGHLLGLNVYEGTAADGTLRLPSGAELHFAGAVAGPALATVRPSAVTVHSELPTGSSARNIWLGAVEELEPLGDRLRLTVVGQLPVRVDVTRAAVAELGLQPGRQVWVSVKASDVSAYPAAPAGEPQETIPGSVGGKRRRRG